jgi:hypothetical protein
MLIKKDGGNRPNDVLATCANKVLKSTLKFGDDKRTQNPDFSDKLFAAIPTRLKAIIFPGSCWF